MGEGSSWLRKRWPQAQPKPGVCWRRRRRRAPQRSCSTLWEGKAARNLPDPPLHPPPSSLFPPSGSSSLPPAPLPPRNQQLAPTCPMAALSNALAEKSPRDYTPGAMQGVVRGQLQPRALGKAARKANQDGSAGRQLRAHRVPSLHPARPLVSGARTHLALASPPAQDCGGSRPTEGVLQGRWRVNYSSLPGECVWLWLECEESKPERAWSPFGPQFRGESRTEARGSVVHRPQLLCKV